MSQAAVTEVETKTAAVKKAPVKSTLTTPKLPAKKVTDKKALIAKIEKTQVSPKVKREKLIRDSFTIPESEYVVLSTVKKACLNASIEVRKSDLLRIAIGQLSLMSMAKLTSALNGLTKIQTGRPKK
jgi:predicted transcriptional regulator